MTHILFVLYLLAASAAFALLEIQIEGSEGWARSLPTWRWENPFTRRLFGARAMTGYHLWVHVFVLLMLHLPFALTMVPFAWRLEARLIAFWLLLWVVEDFLWFVFNPAWGIRSFRRDRIWWHAPNWWGFMPRDYWLAIPAAVVLYVLSW